MRRLRRNYEASFSFQRSKNLYRTFELNKVPVNSINKYKLGTIYIFLELLFSFYSTHAQQWVPNFKHYGIEEGLPSSEVYQVTSDAQKNLWFASDRGAVRFDGYSFRVYDTKDHLPDNSIIKLYRDRKNRIWFISYTSRLAYYDNGKVVVYKFNNRIEEHIGTSIITSMKVDETETVYFNTVEGEEFRIDSSGQFSKDPAAPDTCTFILTAEENGCVRSVFRIGKSNSATSFLIRNNRETFNFSVNEEIRYHHFAAIRAFNGDFIFYCGKNMIRVDMKNKTFRIKKFNAPVLDVYEDKEKNLWIGMRNEGVYRFDSSQTASSHFLDGLSVSHTYSDFEGGFWLSTLENGLYYLPSINNSALSGSSYLSQEKINSILDLSDTALIFASAKGNLYLFSSKQNSLDQLNLKETAVASIEALNSLYYMEPEKRLIVGTFTKLTPDSVQINTINWKRMKMTIVPSLTKFFQGENGTLTGSDFSFVYSLHPEKKIKDNINEKPLRSTALFKDKKGNLFAGTLRGLFILKDRNFVPFETTNEIFRKRVTDINELDTGVLVVATRNDGIIIHSGKISHVINMTNGLSSDNVNRIHVEKNTIWAGTSRGLNKITLNHINPLSLSIQHFDASDGLLSDEINDLAIGTRQVFLATNKGVNAIDKSRVKNDVTNLPIYITSLKINGIDTILRDAYSLNYKHRNINISYTAVSFRNSKNILYRYRMLGMDTMWTTTPGRDVRFSLVQSGTYKFQLQLLPASENYRGKTIEILFTVTPPFYKAKWFLVILSIVVILVTMFLVNLRIKSIREKEEKNTAVNKKISELNLKALRSQMNPHFTFNVLNSIQYYVAKKDTEQALQYISKFSRLIRMILEQSRSLYISLDDEIKMLTLYLELEELRFENKFTYSVVFDQDLDLRSVSIPSMLIQPIVENAVKHGVEFKKGEARIEIQFKLSASVLTCEVKDNGIGRNAVEKMKPDREYKSIGMDIIKDRIEALNLLLSGNFKTKVTDLEDAEGNPKGTCVSIEIPFKHTTE